MTATQPFSPPRIAALLSLCAATPLLVTLEQYALGAVALLVCIACTVLTRDAVFQRRFGVLIVCTALLTLAPIATSTDTIPALILGAFFVAVIALPHWALSRPRDSGVIEYQWLPKHFSKLETAYVLLSIPLAWAGLRLYFTLSPEVPFNWTLPALPSDEPLLRLFVGINAVGIWDELFFINTVYAVLRSLFPFWTANLASSVFYVAVLNDMAFTGWGPVFVGVLAITQGIMFERSKTLIYVLVVHLIVDPGPFQRSGIDALYGLLSGGAFGAGTFGYP